MRVNNVKQSKDVSMKIKRAALVNASGGFRGGGKVNGFLVLIC